MTDSTPPAELLKAIGGCIAFAVAVPIVVFQMHLPAWTLLVLLPFGLLISIRLMLALRHHRRTAR